jgi:hydroxyacylglutathione hydrolase
MDRFATLPKETQVYCAHEYTLSNLKFLNSIDPERCVIELRLLRTHLF